MMKTKTFSPKENKEIYVACCTIFFFSSVFLNFKDKKGLKRIFHYVQKHYWEKLFKNETWLDCIREAVKVGPGINPIKKEIILISKQFDEYIYHIVFEFKK